MPAGIRGYIVAAAHGVLQRTAGDGRVSQHESDAEARQPSRNAHRYNAFISYHRETDGEAAPAFQTALHRFAKPWYRLRAVRVFLDDASMSSGPLRSAIERALDDAEFFVLFASPQAAESEWVKWEVAQWRKRKEGGRLLLVLTAGEDLVWDEEHRDFDRARNPPLPSTIRGAFDEEPRWSDLRRAKEQGDLSLRNPDFRRAVADVAAALHHRPREEIEGEDVRQHRRTVRLARGAAVALVTLTVLALLAAVYAVRQRDEARAERDLATSRYLAAQAGTELGVELDRALLLSAEAVDSDESAEAKGALLGGLQRAAESHVRTFLHGDAAASSAAFSSGGGDVLASGNADGTIQLWDVVHGRRLGRPLVGHGGRVQALQFSPTESDVLVSGGEDGKVILWNVDDRVRHELPLGDDVDFVVSVAFSKSGKTVAVSAADSGGEIGKIFRWSVPARRRLGEPIYTHGLPALDLAFSPKSESTLVAVIPDSQGDRVAVWHLSQRGRHAGVPRWRLPAYVTGTGGVAGVSELAFSRTGEVLALGGGNPFTGEDGRVGLVDVMRDDPLGEPLVSPGASFVTDVAFSPADDDILAVGSADGRVTLWDVTQRERLGQPLTAGKHAVEDVEFGPDGETLASVHDGGVIVVWKLVRSEVLGIRFGFGRRSAPATDLVFSPDGRTLAVKSYEDVALWNVEGPRPFRRSVERTGGFDTSIAFSSDGETLVEAYGAAGNVVVLRDVLEDRPLGEPLRSGRASIADLAFSRDGKKLAGTTQEGTVMLWDLKTRQRLDTPFTNLRPGTQSVAWTPPLAFSPDGEILASAHENGEIVLWEIPGKERLGEQLPGHADLVTGLAFSPDGELLASGSRDGTIILWDVERRRDIAQLTSASRGWLSVAFSPDGQLLASGGDNGRTVLWDLERQQPLDGSLHGTGPLAFSPDGTKLASGSRDGRVVLWETRVTSWKAKACAVANRNLSQAEWDRFVGGAYERTCPNLPAGEGVDDS